MSKTMEAFNFNEVLITFSRRTNFTRINIQKLLVGWILHDSHKWMPYTVTYVKWHILFSRKFEISVFMRQYVCGSLFKVSKILIHVHSSVFCCWLVFIRFQDGGRQWSAQPEFGVKSFKMSLSRNRSRDIKTKYFYLADNANIVDWFAKVRRLLPMLNMR